MHQESMLLENLEDIILQRHESLNVEETRIDQNNGDLVIDVRIDEAANLV